MKDLVSQCRELGFGSRIVSSQIELSVVEVREIGGKSLEEFNDLNRKEETGIDKWLKMVKGREYDGDEIILELLIEVYKKLEKIEQQVLLKHSHLLQMDRTIKTCYIGHEFLCFKEMLNAESIYYGRMDLPLFPAKLVPFYFKMLTPNIAKIVKMGNAHTRSYDSYVVECERISIREKKYEETL